MSSLFPQLTPNGIRFFVKKIARKLSLKRVRVFLLPILLPILLPK